MGERHVAENRAKDEEPENRGSGTIPRYFATGGMYGIDDPTAMMIAVERMRAGLAQLPRKGIFRVRIT